MDISSLGIYNEQNSFLERSFLQKNKFGFLIEIETTNIIYIMYGVQMVCINFDRPIKHGCLKCDAYKNFGLYVILKI